MGLGYYIRDVFSFLCCMAREEVRKWSSYCGYLIGSVGGHVRAGLKVLCCLYSYSLWPVYWFIVFCLLKERK